MFVKTLIHRSHVALQQQHKNTLSLNVYISGINKTFKVHVSGTERKKSFGSRKRNKFGHLLLEIGDRKTHSFVWCVAYFMCLHSWVCPLLSVNSLKHPNNLSDSSNSSDAGPQVLERADILMQKNAAGSFLCERFDTKL